MKNAYALFPVLCACALTAACGSGESSVPAVSTVAMTREQIRKFQADGAPCLSLDRIYALIGAAKQSRSSVVNASVDDDGMPVSQAFARSVVHNTDFTKTPVQVKNPGFRQNGCESISVLDSSGREVQRVALTKATDLALETDKFDVHQNPGEPVEYMQLSANLVSAGSISWNWTMAYTTSHDQATCGIAQEDHEVHFNLLTEFGDAIGVAPTPAPALAALEQQARDYDDPGKELERKANEASYCSRLAR
jgi:hypothetical protein